MGGDRPAASADQGAALATPSPEKKKNRGGYFGAPALTPIDGTKRATFLGGTPTSVA